MYCPVLVTQEGSALWGNTFATALLHDPKRTIPFELMVQDNLMILQSITVKIYSIAKSGNIACNTALVSVLAFYNHLINELFWDQACAL